MPYHVRITAKDPRRRHRDALALDKNANWIEVHIAAPRRRGRDIFVDGQVFSWEDIDQIHISETDQTSEQIIPQIRAQGRNGVGTLIQPSLYKWHVAYDASDVTEHFITGPPGTGPSTKADEAASFAANRKAVMVIYGHDTEANSALFDWLRAIGLQPQEWTQLIHATGNASPYIGQVLDKALQDVQAVIAYFTPDEYVTAAATTPHGQTTGRLQARPNVLIEAGMALITHPPAPSSPYSAIRNSPATSPGATTSGSATPPPSHS